MSEQEKQPDNQTTQPVKKKKTCRKILCVGSAVIFVPVLGLVTALSFDGGQRALIQLTDKMLDSLSIEQVSGGLQDGLVLENLRFQTTGVDVALPKTRLQLNLARLLSGDIIVDDLSLTQPKIAIDTSVMPPSEEKQTESGPMEKIHLPVSVQVKKVEITDFDMKLDQSNITFSSFQSAVSLNNDGTYGKAGSENSRYRQGPLQCDQRLHRRGISAPCADEPPLSVLVAGGFPTGQDDGTV